LIPIHNIAVNIGYRDSSFRQNTRDDSRELDD
jgi:hypothetical protein